jgi:hypothetical protein
VCHEDVEPDVNLDWYTGWPSFITGPKFSIRWEGKLTPSETGNLSLQPEELRARRVYLDGKEVPHNYDSMESWTVPVELVAGKEYDFKFETANSALGAFRASSTGRLRRFTPGKRSSSQREDKKRLSAGRDFLDRFLDGREAGRRQKPSSRMLPSRRFR